MDQLKIHREFERKGISILSEIMCAHYGLPKESEENYFKPADIEAIRSEAKTVNKIFSATAVRLKVR
jgi:hypothetical protein